MYAIVEIGGMQCKVSKSSVVRVPKLDKEPGKTIQFESVLLIVDKENITLGNPLVDNASVQAKVISHGREAKVLVFKKKRRKGYKVKKGHRQDYTELEIAGITMGKSTAGAETAGKEQKPAAKKPAGDIKPDAGAAAEKKKAAAPKTDAVKKKTAAKPAGAEKKASPKAAAAPKTASTKKPSGKKETSQKSGGTKKE